MSKNVDSPHVAEHIEDIDVCTEMETSFLEYAYSVIYSRALPDARDGLKPVQRRILYQMDLMGLRPERGHVKSARVVGEVMGKLHPHGDTAIYDALVRLSQPFNLRVPLVDGHGNFGSLDCGPAAPRYTEARLAPAALALTDSLDEDVVDFVPNYDNQFMQPSVLPASFPNFLVNGASGIAVGMATSVPPHNLGEVVAAACHLVDNPNATWEELMLYVPGPDFPEGGTIVGLDGVREAYEGGRGVFRTRAKVKIERISARKQGIVVTELPYMVGPERVMEKLKEAVNARKVQGVSAVSDLTDRHHGLRLIVEVKNGFNPEAVLEQLYRYTPLEESFGVNAVALVDGQPQTLGLKQILDVFVNHRLEVTTRRTKHRLATASKQLHLIDGLLIAIVDIDAVIAVIRAADDAAAAKIALMETFALSELQAEHILELRLRRLTKFSRLELETKKSELEEQIANLQQILATDAALRQVVKDELQAVSAKFATPRRTVLLADSGQEQVAKDSLQLEIADDPCLVLLGPSGTVARISSTTLPPRDAARAPFDVLAGNLEATTRGEIGVVLADGSMHRLSVIDIPAIPMTSTNLSLAGAVSANKLIEGQAKVIGLASVHPDSTPLALATRNGVIKRVRPEYPGTQTQWTVIALEDGDEVIGCAHATDDAELVMVTSDAQLLRTTADKVRPQGRQAGGMAGMKLRGPATVLALGVVGSQDAESLVVTTVAVQAETILGAAQGGVKVTPLSLYPVQGRAGGGVRVQRLLKGEVGLCLAAVTADPPLAIDQAGAPVDLPAADERRDGSGHSVSATITSIG